MIEAEDQDKDDPSWLTMAIIAGSVITAVSLILIVVSLVV